MTDFPSVQSLVDKGNYDEITRHIVSSQNPKIFEEYLEDPNYIQAIIEAKRPELIPQMLRLSLVYNSNPTPVIGLITSLCVQNGYTFTTNSDFNEILLDLLAKSVNFNTDWDPGLMTECLMIMIRNGLDPNSIIDEEPLIIHILRARNYSLVNYLVRDSKLAVNLDLLRAINNELSVVDELRENVLERLGVAKSLKRSRYDLD